MSDTDEPAYSNSHRAFLQAFLARSTFTLAEAKPVLVAIESASTNNQRPVLPGDITEADFLSYVSFINAAISPFDFEIRNTQPQQIKSRNDRDGNGNESAAAEGQRIWAIVNTTSDPITQLATTHTPDEIAFLKRCLDDMFIKYNTTNKEIMAISNMQAVRLHKASASDRGSLAGRTELGDGEETARPAGQSITMPQADKMLKSLVAEGWFEMHKGDYYTLSPRALMELRGWLLETYNEPPEEDGDGGIERIKLCHACREIVTSGQRCGVRSCKARLHDHCTQGVWRAQRGEQRCPVCREEWEGTGFVGLRVVWEADRRRSGGGAGRRRSETVVEEDEQEGSSDGE